MSSAGHVMDAINRLNNNRKMKQERLAKFEKVKEAYQTVKVKYPKFTDKNKLNPTELKELKIKIRLEILQQEKRAIIISLSVAIFIVLASIPFIVKLFKP